MLLDECIGNNTTLLNDVEKAVDNGTGDVFLKEEVIQKRLQGIRRSIYSTNESSSVIATIKNDPSIKAVSSTDSLTITNSHVSNNSNNDEILMEKKELLVDCNKHDDKIIDPSSSKSNNKRRSSKESQDEESSKRFDVIPDDCNNSKVQIQQKSLDSVVKSDVCSGIDHDSMIKISEHPILGKYIKMLKFGAQKEAIRIKMQSDGIDASYLDRKPDSYIPITDSGQVIKPTTAVVLAMEHPVYAKYYKMLKIGVPKTVVIMKMTSEKINTQYFVDNPNEFIPLELLSVFGTDAANANSQTSGQLPRRKSIRKKKLHLRGVDASKLDKDSLWADKSENNDIVLDEEEFNSLFTQEEADSLANKKVETVEKKKSDKEYNSVTVIDPKRAQNASIALARIKFTYDQIRTKILALDDCNFTTEQLVYLEEYLPNSTEIKKLTEYVQENAPSDENVGLKSTSNSNHHHNSTLKLSKAEQYMLAMMNTSIPLASKCLRCMAYKQAYKSRIYDSKTKLTIIENACNEVRTSSRLKKLLKTILKVNNVLNDDQQCVGFSMDSLLKLQVAKAFDKKTSILQYVVLLLYRNDMDSLLFPEDLAHVSQAARLALTQIQSEISALIAEQQVHESFVQNYTKNGTNCTNSTNISSGLTKSLNLDSLEEEIHKLSEATEINDLYIVTMHEFMHKANILCEDMKKRCEHVTNKYKSVLQYLGEEESMNSMEFFSIFSQFINEFTITVDKVDRAKKAEAKRVAVLEKKNAKLSSNVDSKNTRESLSLKLLPPNEQKLLKLHGRKSRAAAAKSNM